MTNKSDTSRNTLSIHSEDVKPDIPRNPHLIQGKEIEAALRRAVNRALLTHKRAGNSIAVWRDGKVVIVPAEEISVPKVWAHLSSLLRKVVLLRDASLNAPAAADAAAEAATPWEDGQTEDGMLRWRIKKDKEGSLTIRFGSHVLGEGGRLRLCAGDWQREIVLRPVAPDQVGAEIVITREERERIPSRAELRVEPVADALDADSTV